MIDENFALSLVSPKVKPNPTLPFSKEEMTRILKAAEDDEVDPRVRTFILTMRYSGLRISDVATLRTDSLSGNRLKLYQAKTGEPSRYCSLRMSLTLCDLSNVRIQNTSIGVAYRSSPQPPASGVRGSLRSSSWPRLRRAIRIGCAIASQLRCSRLGVSLENVSVLLGHQDVRITQKHYSPWIKTRQDALDKAVESAFKS